MSKTTVAILAASLISPVLSSAEEFPGLAIGQTVRVTKAPDQQADATSGDPQPLQTLPGRFKAEVVAMDDDSISVSTNPDADPIVLPRRNIGKLEISRGRSHTKGGGIGLGIGLVIGLIAGLASDDDECDPMLFDCANATGGNSTGKDALLGALAGAAVGGIIGVQRWESIDPTGAEVALTLPRRGVGAGISISW